MLGQKLTPYFTLTHRFPQVRNPFLEIQSDANATSLKIKNLYHFAFLQDLVLENRKTIQWKPILWQGIYMKP